MFFHWGGFPQRKLEELYKETLTYTVTRKDNDQAVARGSIPISRLKIGKKVGYDSGIR
jgi:hypothetical protein